MVNFHKRHTGTEVHEHYWVALQPHHVTPQMTLALGIFMTTGLQYWWAPAPQTPRSPFVLPQLLMVPAKQHVLLRSTKAWIWPMACMAVQLLVKTSMRPLRTLSRV